MQKQKQTKKPPSLFSVMQNQNKKNATTEATQNIQRKCAGLTAFISNCHHNQLLLVFVISWHSICRWYEIIFADTVLLKRTCLWKQKTLTFTILTINMVCWLVKGFIKASGDGRVFLQNYCSEGAAYRKHTTHVLPEVMDPCSKRSDFLCWICAHSWGSDGEICSSGVI